LLAAYSGEYRDANKFAEIVARIFAAIAIYRIVFSHESDFFLRAGSFFRKGRVPDRRFRRPERSWEK